MLLLIRKFITKNAISGIIFTLSLLFFCTLLAQENSASKPEAKRVIFIDSYYYPVYDWSMGEVNGARSILEPAGLEMKVISMDSKRNPDEAFIKAAALQAKVDIEQWQPDLIIACDDNASKYLIEPYYKNHSIPVVFCGVNWDASIYGYPYKNATGMVEISMIAQLVQELKRYAKGERVGVLAGNVISDRKSVRNFEKKAHIKFRHKIFVNTAEQWKKAFLMLQNKVDVVIIENSMSISGWEPEDMHDFVMHNTRIPTGTVQPVMQPYVLIGFLQVPEEQGRYAAKTALRILDGELPQNISIVTNHQVMASVNLDIAEQLGIVFELDFLRNAKSYRWTPGHK